MISNPKPLLELIKILGIYAYISAQDKQRLMDMSTSQRKANEQALRRDVNKLRAEQGLSELQ